MSSSSHVNITRKLSVVPSRIRVNGSTTNSLGQRLGRLLGVFWQRNLPEKGTGSDDASELNSTDDSTSDDNDHTDSHQHHLHGDLNHSTQSRPLRVNRWIVHILLVNLVELTSESARGLVLPVLFSYSELLHGDMAFLALLTSLFAGGRFVGSLCFGFLSDRIGFKTVYLLSCCIAMVGHTLYVVNYAPSWRSRTLLATSRLVAGIGAGNRSACRANIAFLTPVSHRLPYFTLLAMVIFIGYAITPGLSGILGETNWKVVNDTIQINKFTMPGVVLMVMDLCIIVMVVFVFDSTITSADSPYSSQATQTQQARLNNQEQAQTQDQLDGNVASTSETERQVRHPHPERRHSLGANCFGSTWRLVWRRSWS